MTFLRAAALVAFASSLVSPLVSQHARLNVLHGIPGLPAPVDVFVNGSQLFSFDYLDIEGPLDLPAGSYALDVRLNGASVLQATAVLVGGRNYSVIANLDATGTPALNVYDNDISAIAAGQSRLVVRHTAQAPAVDVGVDQNGSRVATFGPLSNPGQVQADVASGTYDASIFPAGTTSSVFGPATLMLEPAVSYILYAVGDVSGTSFTVLTQTIEFNPDYGLTPFGTNCGAAQISTDGSTTSAARPFNLFLSGATPNAPVILLFGFSTTEFMGTPLPFDLGPRGAPGCSILVAPDLSAPLMTNGAGVAAVSLAIPDGFGLFVDRGYFQYAYGSPANALGFEVTAGVELLKR